MKRSFDWEMNNGDSVMIHSVKSSFCEPQLKNHVTERDLSRNGSSEKAKEIRKHIEQSTLNKLFEAQKNLGKREEDK